jgi:hypothetical protein
MDAGSTTTAATTTVETELCVSIQITEKDAGDAPDSYVPLGAYYSSDAFSR